MTARRILLLAALLAAASASAWGQLTINPATLSAAQYPVNQTTPTFQFSVAPPYQNDPISWSLSSGNLPPGLNFDPVKGAIPPGTPTQAGAFTFTVSAVDNQPPVPVMGSRQYTLYISLGQLTLTPLSILHAAAGNFYLALPFQVGGGVPGYTWAIQSGANADGLAINSSSGQLTGVPQAGGIFPITIVATDASSATASATANLNVLGISTASLPNGAIGSAYSQTLAVAPGGTGPFSWIVTGSPQPPPGLTLSPQGQITGTPTTPGTYSFQVQVTDTGTDLSSFKTLSITVPASLTISPTSLPNGIINTAYSQTLTAVGSAGPFTWSLSSGALPDGLNFNGGQITGTPTKLGTFSFQVMVSDPIAKLSAIQSLTITVTTALTVTTTSLPNGTVNVNYSQVVQATGGAPPYRWSATGLPAVLTMDPVTGTLSGLPAAAGTSTISVTVTDATQANAGARLSLTIGGPAISPATLPSGFVNVPYSVTLSIPGNSTGISWEISPNRGQTLPGGLEINPATGVISGTTPLAGSFTFTVLATLDAPIGVQPTILAQQYTLVINTVAITGLPSVGVAATQSTATVSLSGGTYQSDITGTLTLTFTPVPGGSQLYDAKFATGPPTTANFTIPAGASSSASIPLIIGTVAGTITLTPTVNGVVLQSAVTTIPVNPTVPVIKGVTIGTVTTSGFSISVTGYSTPRDMTSALFHFTSPTNTTLTSADVTVPLTTAFTTWYGSPTSIPFGSTFVMTVQFSFTGPPGTTVPFTAVTVTLTNSIGPSNTSAPFNP